METTCKVSVQFRAKGIERSIHHINSPVQSLFTAQRFSVLWKHCNEREFPSCDLIQTGPGWFGLLVQLKTVFLPSAFFKTAASSISPALFVAWVEATTKALLLFRVLLISLHQTAFYFLSLPYLAQQSSDSQMYLLHIFSKDILLKILVWLGRTMLKCTSKCCLDWKSGICFDIHSTLCPCKYS